MYPFPKASARSRAPWISIFHKSATVSIVVVLRRNLNVSTRVKIFASQQTLHTVCEQYKQVFSTKFGQFVEHCISVAVIIGRVQARSLFLFGLQLSSNLNMRTYLRWCLVSCNDANYREFFSNLQGVSFLYIGIQYSASIMSRNGVNSKREKMRTDRMLKRSKDILT